MAVDASPFAARLEAGGATYTYFPVSAIEGSAELPYALKVLLENVLRNGEDADAARELARRVVDAGRAGTVATRWNSAPPACFSKTSRAFPFSWTSRSCARRAPNWGATRARSTPRFPATS